MITLENKKVSAAVKIDSVPKPVTSTVVEAPRGVKQVIKFTTNESGQQVGVLETIREYEITRYFFVKYSFGL